MRVLGISAYYHDAAAAIVVDGRLLAAAEEERFTRRKHDPSFPANAVQYCLREAKIGRDELDAVVFYEKPLLKFHRIVETVLAAAPRGRRNAVRALGLWARERLWIPLSIQRGIDACGVRAPDEIAFTRHHEAHAASAFYPSPFERAAIVTIDGVGEWATTAIAEGEGSRLTELEEVAFPHSLGLLYSAFTYQCGFRVNSGEYKLMGLAPHGRPIHRDFILERLVERPGDGSFRLALEYFGFLDGHTITSDRFHERFGPPRRPNQPLEPRHADLAASAQAALEVLIADVVTRAHARTGHDALCLAGGVALNCVANRKIVDRSPFERVWIQPAAGDAGGAVGAALAYWHRTAAGPRPTPTHDAMQGAQLGPEFSEAQLADWLARRGYPHRRLEPDAWAEVIADQLVEGRVLGLFDGRMEFGPRALGQRSILADPRDPTMRDRVNARVKLRESFRPFAPAVMAERAHEWFELDHASPYMLLTAMVRSEHRHPDPEVEPLSIMERAQIVRSVVPAVTHVDGSARVQTVHAGVSPRFHAILAAFEARTGCPMLLNTSFNVRGEPIVCTPEDAYRCAMQARLDALILGPFLLERDRQPQHDDASRWYREFTAD
jgi:carbamoyltransferase